MLKPRAKERSENMNNNPNIVTTRIACLLLNNLHKGSPVMDLRDNTNDAFPVVRGSPYDNLLAPIEITTTCRTVRPADPWSRIHAPCVLVDHLALPNFHCSGASTS